MDLKGGHDPDLSTLPKTFYYYFGLWGCMFAAINYLSFFANYVGLLSYESLLNGLEARFLYVVQLVSLVALVAMIFNIGMGDQPSEPTADRRPVAARSQRRNRSRRPEPAWCRRSGRRR